MSISGLTTSVECNEVAYRFSQGNHNGSPDEILKDLATIREILNRGLCYAVAENDPYSSLGNLELDQKLKELAHDLFNRYSKALEKASFFERHWHYVVQDAKWLPDLWAAIQPSNRLYQLPPEIPQLLFSFLFPEEVARLSQTSKKCKELTLPYFQILVTELGRPQGVDNPHEFFNKLCGTEKIFQLTVHHVVFASSQGFSKKKTELRVATLQRYLRFIPKAHLTTKLDLQRHFYSLFNEPSDHRAALCYLLKAGISIDIKDDKGNSLIHIAVNRSRADYLELFLQNGADPNTTNGSEFTPLMSAALSQNLDLVKILLAHKADPNLPTKTKVSALTLQQDLEITRVLLEHGAAVDHKGIGGMTALHIAAKEGLGSLAELLLEKNANADICDNKGNTALYYAVKKGYTQIVKLLLNKGADPDLKNKKGQTARDLASDSIKELLAAPHSS